MKTLFLAAPPETFIAHKDTTRVLMESAAAYGLAVYAATHLDLKYQSGQVVVAARQLNFTSAPQSGQWFTANTPEILPLSGFDFVWFRSDPPFDVAYLHATQLASQTPGPIYINDPAGLRAANEKLLTLQFPELIAPTFLSSNMDDIIGFVDQVGGKAVVKPIDGFGGSGIFLLRHDDPNLRVILQTVTQQQTTTVMAQAYIPEVYQGDLRILLMDGEILGQFLRIPYGGEFRGNMMQGGKVAPAQITAVHANIIATVSSTLKIHGLRLVGLDIIGNYLTEINVTSPTGFQEVQKLTNVAPATIVWQKLMAQKHSKK